MRLRSVGLSQDKGCTEFHCGSEPPPRSDSSLRCPILRPELSLSLVGLPGEPFTRIVLDIKARSGRPHTAVVSYCGDEAGYFPDRQAFAEGTYEAFIIPYRDDVGDLLADRAVRLLPGA